MPPPPNPSLTQLANHLAALRKADPAAVAQQQVEAALTPVERGQLVTELDAATPSSSGWRQSFDAAMAAPRAMVAFQSGVRDGLFEGAKSFVTGTAALVGKTVQLAGDAGAGGLLGDKLRGVTGNLPGAVDAIVPSRACGNATNDGLGQTATAIKDYAVSRAQDPHQLLADTGGVIDRNWSSLKARTPPPPPRGQRRARTGGARS